MEKKSNEQSKKYGQQLLEEQLETVQGGFGKVKWVAHCFLCGWISEVPEENADTAVGRAKEHTLNEKHDTFYYTPYTGIE